MTESATPGKIGLVLPGGGARAAYQVGVLRAIADLLPTRAINPFPVVTGTSAGAVNATAIAVHADRFRVAVGNLERVWRNFQVGQVFRADTASMMRSGLHWTLAMMSGGWLLPPPKSLFDNSPLRELLAVQFDFAGVRRSIAAGHLDALAMSAAGYISARSVSFFEARAGDAWTRMRRAGQPTQLSLDHLMASVAVPFLFPPVLMGDEYYGDGAMREANPFSAAIHLGAERLLVIGTRNESRPPSQAQQPLCPTFGQIFGYMLDSLFSDGLYSDLERLTQLNEIVAKVGPISAEGARLKKIDMLVILPSRDLSEIARHHVSSLPRALRILLRTMGALNTGGGQLMSYLLFQDTYTRELIALGYQDAMKRSHDLLAFLGGHAVASSGATGTLRRLQTNESEGRAVPG
jgi:NTE family protein